jgi:diaminohydroxyphosphoribosylaminopyrimidine deaminase/5-amino-6-(5-phosphoribosylamino)uracil reductase
MIAKKEKHSNSLTWDERWMQRALDLAVRGLGKVSPNPMVGAVLVYNNGWIGEGWHEQFGGPHAEIMALENLSPAARSYLPQSTLYVTLEPCSHYGKTPPCSLRIIQEKVKRVVIGTLDPNPLVAGSGMQLLENAGIEVTTGVLSKQADALIRTFRQGILYRRPYVLLKWAQSKEGYLGVTDHQVKLSQAATDRLVHQWRSHADGILIGSGTAIADQPRLSNRYWWGKQPRKFILDRRCRLDPSAEWLQGTTLFQGDVPSLPSLLERLYEEGIGVLLVEGGASLHQSFLEAGLWDELKVIQTSVSLNTGVKAPEVPGLPKEKEIMGMDSIFTYLRCP